MTSQSSTLRAFTDAAADRIAHAIAGVEREARRERELRDAQFAARMAELSAAIASVRETERRLVDRLATVKDGAPGRDGLSGLNGKDGLAGDPGRDGNDGRDGANGRDGVDGKNADPVEIVRLLVPEVERRFVENPIFQGAKGDQGERGLTGEPGAAGPQGIAGERGLTGEPGPRGEPGEKGEPGLKGDTGDVGIPGPAGIAGEPGIQGPTGDRGEKGADGKDGIDGKLPLLKEWVDGVHYEGDVVSHAGGSWQALRDTGREPPHADWICLAAAGRNGVDGRSFTVHGTWNEGGGYRALDVVAMNGAAFVAKVDDPGVCPGEGWQMIAMQGKQGKPGNPGPATKGEPGRPGPSVAGLSIDADGLLTLINADGSEVTCDLYPLLARLG